MDDALGSIEWPVRTERLSLRRVEAKDAEATWRYRKLPEVAQWITSAPATLEEHRELFFAEDCPRLNLAVELGQGESRVLIGTIMVRVEDGWGQREIAYQARSTQTELGWSFDPDFGGDGYATEAVHAAVDLCFGQLGLRRVIAECFAANEPSWKLMERLGMRLESHGREDSLHRSGRWLDSRTYALLAREWRQ